MWLLAGRMWINHDGSSAKASLNAIIKDSFVKTDVAHFILIMIFPSPFIRWWFFRNNHWWSIVECYYSSSDPRFLFFVSGDSFLDLPYFLDKPQSHGILSFVHDLPHYHMPTKGLRGWGCMRILPRWWWLGRGCCGCFHWWQDWDGYGQI